MIVSFFLQAGYDTVNSTRYFVIPDSSDGNFIPNLKNSSNVNVPGRWAFRVDSEQGRCLCIFHLFTELYTSVCNIIQHNMSCGVYLSLETVIGLQMKVTSYSDLTENGNIAYILEKVCCVDNTICLILQYFLRAFEHFCVIYSWNRSWLIEVCQAAWSWI